MIKKTLLLVLPFLFLIASISCQQDSNNNAHEGISPDLVTNPITADGDSQKSKLPVMEFKTTSHDFGTIVQGEKVAHKFSFLNNGGSDLIISDASATCGCTVPTYPRKPIKPGKSGEIEVVFNSAGRTGSQHKSISVLTNSQPNTIRLDIDAEIIVVK
jgi:hypothetical protein